MQVSSHTWGIAYAAGAELRAIVRPIAAAPSPDWEVILIGRMQVAPRFPTLIAAQSYARRELGLGAPRHGERIRII